MWKLAVLERKCGENECVKMNMTEKVKRARWTDSERVEPSGQLIIFISLCSRFELCLTLILGSRTAPDIEHATLLCHSGRIRGWAVCSWGLNCANCSHNLCPTSRANLLSIGHIILDHPANHFPGELANVDAFACDIHLKCTFDLKPKNENSEFRMKMREQLSIHRQPPSRTLLRSGHNYGTNLRTIWRSWKGDWVWTVIRTNQEAPEMLCQAWVAEINPTYNIIGVVIRNNTINGCGDSPDWRAIESDSPCCVLRYFIRPPGILWRAKKRRDKFQSLAAKICTLLVYTVLRLLKH